MLRRPSCSTERWEVRGTAATETTTRHTHRDAIIVWATIAAFVRVAITVIIIAETIVARIAITANLHSCTGTRTSDVVRVAAQHRDARTKLGTTEGNHVFAGPISKLDNFDEKDLIYLPNMARNKFSVVRSGVHQNPLNQVVPVLITSN